MNKNIEVEGGEIAIRNSHGDLAIIPKNKRNWVKQKLSEGCHSCIDNLVSTLPVAAEYAQDGSLYSEYLTQDPPSNKKHPLDPNPDGSLPSHFKGSDENPIQLDEVIITAEAPDWVKYKKQYLKDNPFNIDKYVEDRFNNPVGREAIEKIDAEGWKKKLRQEGLEKRYNSTMDYVGEQLVLNKPQGKLSRAEWLNQMSDKEEEIVKRNPKYQSSLWADTKRGITSLMEKNPLETASNILQSKDYTQREKVEMLKDYADHPIMSKLGDAAKIFNPLSVPSKMVQSTYKDDYSFSDAVKGKKNNAGIVEDIVTDPLNLVGVGLVGKLSKADKVIDAVKAVDKISDISKPTNILKFDDFKNENEFFRIIVGDEAFDDIIKTGQIRVQRPSSYKTEPGVINLDRRGTTPSPSFSKGKPSIEYAKGNPEHYIIRTSEPLKPSTMGAHGKGSTMFPTDEAGKHLKSLDASKTQVYKHIGNGEYELVDVTKAGSKMLNKTDDVVKNLPKLEQIPLDFKIEDVLKNISSTERKNMEITKKGNAYFRELDNPESLKRLKEFGDEYGIDLLDAYKKAEQRWDYGNNIGKNDRFQVAGEEVFKDDIESALGLSTFDKEGMMKGFLSKDKFADKSLENHSINYVNKKASIEDYNTIVWHELSHDINKNIIGQSTKLQKDLSDIFVKNIDEIDKTKIEAAYKSQKFDTYEKGLVKSKKENMSVEDIAKDELTYVSKPTETWAFLSTNLRQDLKNTGVIKNYNEILTPEKLEKAIKNGNTVFSRFEPYIKDKDAFIKLFNKMTLSIVPAALYLQSQQNKSEQ